MIAKPCNACNKKRTGCLCPAYSAWINDDSPPEPTLNLPKRIHKFNTRIIDTPFTETQKYTGGGRIAGFRDKRKEI